MPDPALPNHDPMTYAAAPTALGRVVLLIDESISMEARIADGTKPKAEAAATAINSLLKQLGAFTGLEIALVGYRAGQTGEPEIGCRWAGPLEGRTFVASQELRAAPLAVEIRTRKVASAAGATREEKVEFPVWYAPRLGLMASRAAAMEHCLRILAQRAEAAGSCSKPPLIVSFVGDLATVNGLGTIAQTLLQSAPSPAPLLFHVHLSSSSRIPPTLYPSIQAHLPPGPVQEIFDASSVLPEPLTVALREAQAMINPGARGMIVNARLADLIRLMSLVKAYAGWMPVLPAAATAAPMPATVAMPQPAGAVPAMPQPLVSEANDAHGASAGPALVLLLLDRSSAEPTAKSNVFTRLAANANDVLAQIAKRGGDRLAAAVVAYGADASGSEEPLLGFSGPLAGRRIVSADELTAGALRIEETVEKVSNGIGGIIEWTRKRPIWIDMPAAHPAGCAAAAEAAAAIVAEWRAAHPAAPVVVVHLTRGAVDPQPLENLPPDVLVYHYLTTESPHRSLAYPDRAEQLDPSIERLWRASSKLLDAERLSAARPGVTAESRGFVVNGKFDLLVSGLLPPPPKT